MRKNKGLYAVILVVVLAASLFVVGCNKEPTTQPPAVTVTLSQTAVELEPNATVQLTAAVTGIENAKVEWTTSDSAIARVDGGLVTAMAVGYATVTAKVGDASATCSVTVSDNAMPLLSFGRDKVELVVGGDPIPLTATVTYNGAAVEAEVNWTSGDTSIVTVANGVLTPVAVGNTTVTASATYLGKDAEATLPVKVVSSSRVSVSTDCVTLATYQTATQNTSAQVTAELLINSVKVDGATFSAEVTDGDAVQATIDGNTVTIAALTEGKATVTVTGTKEGTTLSTQIEVTVTRGVVAIDRTFAANLYAGDVALDFSSYDWGDDVVALYAGENEISAMGQPNVVRGDWLSEQEAGTQKTVKVQLPEFDATVTIRCIDEVRTITFKPLDGTQGQVDDVKSGAGVTGFTAADRVQEYRATGSAGWYTVVEATSHGVRGDFREKDWWVFDIVFAEDLHGTDEGTVLLFSGAHHIVRLRADGTSYCENDSFAGGTQFDTSCLTVYDVEGMTVTGALHKNVKYTFAVDLEHCLDGYCLFGMYQSDMTAYIGNAIACSDMYYQEHIATTAVRLDQSTATRYVGETVQLAATVTHAKGQQIVWTSSDDTVASVDRNGLVTAHKKGTATITATVGKASASCVVTVDNKVEMTVDKTQAVVRINETGTVTATVKLNGQAVSDAVIEWTSANGNIATVSGGTVTGVATGDTTVTASCTYDGKPVSVTVDVRIVEQQRVALKMNGSEVTSAQLNTYAVDGKYSIATLTAEMIDNDVPVSGATFSAEVTSGDAVTVEVAGATVTVTAAKAGSATVTVTGSKDGTQKSTTLTVTVARTVLATTASVVADVCDPHAKFDFGKYTWGNAVTALYDGDVVVSVGKNGLRYGWLKTQTAGQTKTLKAVLGDEYMYDVTCSVSFVNVVKPVTLQAMDGCYGTVSDLKDDDTDTGFTAADRVQVYNSGNNSGWNALTEVTVNGNRGDLHGYAVWSFDVVFASDITADESGYSGLIFVGAHHLLWWRPDGTSSCADDDYAGGAQYDTSCLTVTDANGNAVIGTMQKGVRYTFTFDLRMHGQDGYYLFGTCMDSAQSNVKAYVGNSVAYPYAYFEAVAPVSHTATQYDTATFTVNVDDIEWKDDITGVYENGVRISAENSTVLHAAWVNHSAVGTHFVEIRSATRSISAVIDILANEDCRNVRFQHVNEGGNETTVSDVENGKGIGSFTENDRVQTSITTTATGWSSIIEATIGGSRGDITGKDWLVFDVEFGSDLTVEEGISMYFFLGNDSTRVNLTDRGQGSRDGLAVYDMDGNLITATPAKNTRYRFVLQLKDYHQSGAYIVWGVYTPNLTTYIGNAIACSDDYYLKHIAFTSVRLDHAFVSTTANETVQLTATVINPNEQQVVWNSSDSAIASVDQNGLVTAHKKGTVTITATVGKAQAGCTVTVKDVADEMQVAVFEVDPENQPSMGHMSVSEVGTGYTAQGFGAYDLVQKFESNSEHDGIGNNRVKATGLAAYDKWVFDIVFEGDDKGEWNLPLCVWAFGVNNTNVGIKYCGYIENADGKAHVSVYDKDGYAVTCTSSGGHDDHTSAEQKKLVAGQKYTVVVDLTNKITDTDAFYIGYHKAGGTDKTATMYIGNAIACSNAYYQANIAQRFQA